MWIDFGKFHLFVKRAKSASLDKMKNFVKSKRMVEYKDLIKRLITK